MDGLIQIVGQAIGALSIYGILVVTYSLLGAYKNINIFQQDFDWKVYLNGVVKYLALGGSGVVIVACSYALIQLAPGWGVDLQNVQSISSKVIFGILAAGIAGMLLKNIQKLVQIFGTDNDTLVKLQQQALKTDADKPLILDVADLPGQTQPARDDEVASKVSGDPDSNEAAIAAVVEKYLEQIGGRGAVVPTDSPDAFRNAVINNSYNVDGYYGAQCWDGGALFWLNAVGRTLSTGGTGAMRGAWEAARGVNAGSEFELITDRNAIRKGDWCFFGGSQWGHGGMAMSSNLGNYVRLLGQNQSGGNTDNGAPFSEINMSLNNFLGAFRYKRWNTAPAPAPTPAPAPRKSNEEIAAEVKRGDWDNNPIRRQRLIAAGYDPDAIQAIINGGAPKPAPEAPAYSANPDVKVGSNVTPTRAVSYDGVGLAEKVLSRIYPVTEVNGDRAVLGNGLNTAFRTGDLRVVSNPEQAQPAPAAPEAPAGFAVGDTVVPTNLVDYDGTALTQYDPSYTISEIRGDRAVLNARGAVWAAMNTANIRKA